MVRTIPNIEGEGHHPLFALDCLVIQVNPALLVIIDNHQFIIDVPDMKKLLISRTPLRDDEFTSIFSCLFTAELVGGLYNAWARPGALP